MPESTVLPGEGAERARALRDRAERQLHGATAGPAGGGAGPADEARLLHELQVHHLELQLQNEQLEQAQAEMAAARDRYLRLFQLAPVGVLEVAADGSLIEANAAAARLLLGSRDELAGTRLEPRLVLSSVPGWRALLATAAQAGRAWSELQFARPGVALTTVQAEAARDDASGNVLVTLADVSERARSLAAQREAALALERAGRTRSEFLSRMSHELRTPLNVLLGFAQLMLRDARQPLSPAQRAHAEHVERAGQELLALVEKAMDNARADSGLSEPRLQPPSVPAASPSPPQRALRRVLFIGPAAADRAAIEAALAGLPAVSLTDSPDGRAGLRTAGILSADLVIVAPDLTDMSAADVLRALREQAPTREVRCVALLALSVSDEPPGEAANAGFHECWCRPLDSNKLRHRIEALLG